MICDIVLYEEMSKTGVTNISNCSDDTIVSKSNVIMPRGRGNLVYLGYKCPGYFVGTKICTKLISLGQ